MTDKAYIIANEQQEREVLEKLEQEGLMWTTGRKPTDRMPSSISFSEFPYVLFSRNRLSWGLIGSLSDEEIVYDGRKKEQMSDKYVVSQEFMNELEDWKGTLRNAFKTGLFVGNISMETFSNVITDWWLVAITGEESNNRLIAILRWVNGEDVFEIEKPKKWVVRSKEPQGSVDGEPLYIWFVDELTLETETEAAMPPYIRRFNTKEEAQSWANSHQEVIEVEE